MPQSLSQLYIHLVFSTKDRQQFIHDAIAPDLWSYMATVFYDECGSPAKLIGGVEDHGHVLFNLSRTWCVADVVQVVKKHFELDEKTRPISEDIFVADGIRCVLR